MGEAGRQIIDHDGAFTRFVKRLNHMTSDITCAAGDKHGHALSCPPMRPRCYRVGGEDSVFGAGELAAMLNVAYRECAKRSAFSADQDRYRRRFASDRAQPAQTVFR